MIMGEGIVSRARKLKASILNSKHKSKRGRWEWCIALKPQSLPLVRYFISKVMPSKPTQKIPPIGNQVFKCLRLSGTSH